MNEQPQSSKPRSKSNLIIPSGSMFDRARNEACRLDFVSFIELVFQLLNPGRPFLMNWHILALAYHLEQVASRKNQTPHNQSAPAVFEVADLLDRFPRVHAWERSYSTHCCHIIRCGACH
jgi:hypothetical protein